MDAPTSLRESAALEGKVFTDIEFLYATFFSSWTGPVLSFCLSWRKIRNCEQGFGGKHIFSLRHLGHNFR
jgi:hypothetical protein